MTEIFHSYRKNAWSFREISYLLDTFIEAATEAQASCTKFCIGDEVLDSFKKKCACWNIRSQRSLDNIRDKLKNLKILAAKFLTLNSSSVCPYETEKYRNFFEKEGVFEKLEFIQVDIYSPLLKKFMNLLKIKNEIKKYQQTKNQRGKDEFLIHTRDKKIKVVTKY